MTSRKRSFFTKITLANIVGLLAIFVFITGIDKLSDFRKQSSGDNGYHRELILPKNKSFFDDYTGVYVRNNGIPSTSSADLLLTIPGEEPIAGNVDVGYVIKFNKDEMGYRLLVSEIDFEEEFVKIVLYVED